MINIMIKIIRIIQIHYTIYVQKKAKKLTFLTKKNNYINSKKVINYNIFKINQNKFLSINTKKLKTILNILRDDQKQYFTKKKFQIL